MTAWGKTGRVTLEEGWIFGPKIQTVSVDGARVGQVGYWTSVHFWYGRPIDGSFTHAGTSLDAAVLWVLRRVDPALWRQERGEVWRVRTYKCARGWHAIDPQDGQCQGCLRDFPSTIARAHDLATRRAALR